MAKSRKGAVVGLANRDYRPFCGSIGARLCRMANSNFGELRRCEVRGRHLPRTPLNRSIKKGRDP